VKGNEEGDEGELSDLDIDLIPGKEKGQREGMTPSALQG
jgi:hypothetical protein